MVKTYIYFMNTDYYSISIVDYLGILEDGILCLTSVMYMGDYYEGTYWYNDLNDFILKVDIDLLELLECNDNNFEYHEMHKLYYESIKTQLEDYTAIRNQIRHKQI